MPQGHKVLQELKLGQDPFELEATRGDFLEEVVFEQDLKNACCNVRQKCGLKHYH